MRIPSRNAAVTDDLEPLTPHLTWMRVRGLRPATIAQRRNVVMRLTLHLPGPLIDATEADLTAWQSSLVGSPAHLANQTANVVCFYRWCLDHGVTDTNPAARLPRPRVRKGTPRPLSEDALSACLATAAPDVRCWLALGAFAGLRAGEMARLQRQDILDTSTPPVLLVDGKGGKQRVVPASSRVLFELRAYGLPSRGLVFRRRDGRPGPVSPARVSQLVNEHLHGLGIPDTGHAARHRFGTLAYQQSRDLRLVQDLLGHADPATTAAYAAFAAERAAEVVDSISTLTPRSQHVRGRQLPDQHQAPQ